MATFNGGRYIEEQIKSILSQLSEHDELIISDDSSTDNTLSIIESINDPRIVLLHAHFGNAIFNFQHAIKHASKDFIFLADQDDIWQPDKVAKMAPLLNMYDVVVSDAIVVDQNLRTMARSYFAVNNTKKSWLSNLLSNGYLGCCLAFKSGILPLLLPFPKQIPMHDIWIGFVGGIFCKTVFIEDKLILYRRHGKNHSTAGEPSQNSLLRKFELRINLLRYVPLLLFRYFRKRRSISKDLSKKVF